MDKTQEEKFEKHCRDNNTTSSSAWAYDRLKTWRACLEANGIGEEPPKFDPDAFIRVCEQISYSMTKFSNDVSEAMRKGAKRADGIGDNSEKPNIPDRVMDQERGFVHGSGGPYCSDIPDGGFKIDWESRPWATEVRVGYATKNMRPDAIGDRIVTIHRPAPAWVPNDGDAVFYHSQSGDVLIAKVSREYAGLNHVRVLFQNATSAEVRVEKLKPFDASKIGKPWSEI